MAMGDAGYDASQSGGSTLGPTSQRLIAAVQERVATYRAANHLAPTVLVPADAVTASASGLDPHISVPNARLPAGRVARTRGMSEKPSSPRSTRTRKAGLWGAWASPGSMC